MRAGSDIFVKVWVRLLREENGGYKSVVGSSSGLLFNFVKKRNPNTCNNMERPLGYHMKLNYLAMKGHILYDPTGGSQQKPNLCKRSVDK